MRIRRFGCMEDQIGICLFKKTSIYLFDPSYMQISYLLHSNRSMLSCLSVQMVPDKPQLDLSIVQKSVLVAKQVLCLKQSLDLTFIYYKNTCVNHQTDTGYKSRSSVIEGTWCRSFVKKFIIRRILKIQKGYMANKVLIYCIVHYKFEYNFKFYNNKLSEKVDFICLSFIYVMVLCSINCFVVDSLFNNCKIRFINSNKEISLSDKL